MKRIRPVFAALALLPGCNHERPQQAQAIQKESTVSNGATSPTGESHPGEVLFDDKVEGRNYTRKASELPTTMAWVEVAGRYEPVLRIEVTGSPERREATKFGRDGKFLETTVQSAPRPRSKAEPDEQPTPTPTKKP